MKKKEWTSPKLKLIARNTPEEAVLTVCKTAAIVGPTGIYPQCSTFCPAGALCSGVGSA